MLAIIKNCIQWLLSNNFEYSYSNRTIDSYRRVLSEFQIFCEKYTINNLIDINAPLLRKFIKFNQNDQKYSKSGINIRTAALTLFFHWAHRNGFAGHNPILEYKASEKSQREFGGRGGRKPMRLPPVLSTLEFDRLIAEAVAGEGFNPIRDAALITLCLASGLRSEEMTVLRASQVYIEEDYLRVVGKGNKERIVWVDKRLCAIPCQTWSIMRDRQLQKLKRPSDYYFITNRGTPMTTRLVYQQVSRYMKMAEIMTARKGAHTLRHTAASLMLNNKIPITVIQRNFGHEDLETTTKYLHLIANH